MEGIHDVMIEWDECLIWGGDEFHLLSPHYFYHDPINLRNSSANLSRT